MAKTFAHLAGGVAIAAASSQVPIVAYLPKTSAVAITAIVTTILILFFGLAFLRNLSPISPYKYPLAAIIAAVFGQTMSSLVHRLDEKNALLDVTLLTVGVFGGMVAFGIYDNQNLAGWGAYLAAGLVGLLIGYIILILLRATRVISGGEAAQGQTVISGMGVGMFAILTAYDTQKMKERIRACSGVPDYVNEAINFFLDIANLFSSIANAQNK